MGVVVFPDPGAALFFFSVVLMTFGQALLPPSGFNRPLSTHLIGLGCDASRRKHRTSGGSLVSVADPLSSEAPLAGYLISLGSGEFGSWVNALRSLSCSSSRSVCPLPSGGAAAMRGTWL